MSFVWRSVCVSGYFVAIFHYIPEYVGYFSTGLETWKTGDIFWVNRLFRANSLSRGDLVCFYSPYKHPKSISLKRITALAGDFVDLKCKEGDIKQIRIPYGNAWVMGDNQDQSIDSRYHSYIPISSVVGTVPFRVWPPSRFGFIKDDDFEVPPPYSKKE